MPDLPGSVVVPARAMRAPLLVAWSAEERSRMVLQATSPLLRSDFAQSTAGQTPYGDLTDSFVF
jgi:hypothetical protein